MHLCCEIIVSDRQTAVKVHPSPKPEAAIPAGAGGEDEGGVVARVELRGLLPPLCLGDIGRGALRLRFARRSRG